jgi:hypothetical protein
MSTMPNISANSRGKNLNNSKKPHSFANKGLIGGNKQGLISRACVPLRRVTKKTPFSGLTIKGLKLMESLSGLKKPAHDGDIRAIFCLITTVNYTLPYSGGYTTLPATEYQAQRWCHYSTYSKIFQITKATIS